MSSLKCLMLDVDGVLINGRPADGLRWNTSLKADLGIETKDLQNEFFAKYWQEIIIGKRDIYPALTDCLKKIAPSVSPEMLLRYWFEMDSNIDQNLLEDCRELRKRDVRVFLATNQEHLRADYLLNDLGLGEHVDGIAYSANLGVQKPQLEFFQAAAALCGFAYDELILIDDFLENVHAAKDAGWEAVHWTERQRLTKLLRLP